MILCKPDGISNFFVAVALLSQCDYLFSLNLSHCKRSNLRASSQAKLDRNILLDRNLFIQVSMKNKKGRNYTR